MTRKSITTLAILAASLPGAAKEISPEQALSRVAADLTIRKAKGVRNVTPKLVHTATTAGGEAAVYLFSDGGEGFVALSADDAAIPMLGYSDSGRFSAEEMPPQMKWWLEEYGRQIEYARANNLPASNKRRSASRSGDRKAIAPLLKTMWDQVAPFNAQCPLSGNERTWTGCVATAMAQVMKYWNYPEKGTGSITYNIESLEKKVSMDFSLKKFDWEKMLDLYIEGGYSQEEADAVAYLMKAAGYSVKMQYSMDASGALGMNIGKALVKYFNYDGNINYTLRQYYSSGEWEEMMYENLRSVGPVVCGGGSTLGGGHSFVCDGYDGEGLFHFNWGWSGMSDGYFALQALNPDALGTGGGGGGGYNFNQDAIFGIQPPTGAPIEERPLFLSQEGDLQGSISGSGLSAMLSFALTNSGEPMWVNYNPATMKVKFGAMFYPQGNAETGPIYYDISDKKVSLEAGYGTSPQVLNSKIFLHQLNLPDGTYKVVCGSVPVENGTNPSPTDHEGFMEIKPCYGLQNYFVLKAEGGNYTVENQRLSPLKIKGEIVGELCYGLLTTVRVTVENPSDIERTGGFAPVFMDEEGPVLMGESVCLSIPPKGTVTKEWTTPLTSFVTYIDPFFNMPLTFSFFNEWDFEFYTDEFSSTVTLQPNPGFPKVELDGSLEIENSYRQGINLYAPDPDNIHVTGRLSLTEGVFHYPVVLCLCVSAPDSQLEIVSTVSQAAYMDEERKSADLDLTMSFPTAEPGKRYFLVLTYQSPSGLVQINTPLSFRFADRSGIGNLTAEDSDPISCFRRGGEVIISAPAGIERVIACDITGKNLHSRIEYAGDETFITSLPEGFVILHVRDKAGNFKSFKL